VAQPEQAGEGNPGQLGKALVMAAMLVILPLSPQRSTGERAWFNAMPGHFGHAMSNYDDQDSAPLCRHCWPTAEEVDSSC
jgi:hypothetical protein